MTVRSWSSKLGRGGSATQTGMTGGAPGDSGRGPRVPPGWGSMQCPRVESVASCTFYDPYSPLSLTGENKSTHMTVSKRTSEPRTAAHGSSAGCGLRLAYRNVLLSRPIGTIRPTVLTLCLVGTWQGNKNELRVA